MRGQIIQVQQEGVVVRIEERRSRKSPTEMHEREVTPAICNSISQSIEQHLGVKKIPSSVVGAIFSFFVSEDGKFQWPVFPVRFYTRTPGEFLVPFQYLSPISSKEFMRRKDYSPAPRKANPMLRTDEFMAIRMRIAKKEQQDG